MKATIALIAVFLASSAHAAQTLDRVIAVVNDSVITQSELEHEVDTIVRQFRDRNTRLPPADILRKQVLERAVMKELQLQLAKATGIQVDDTDLNNTIDSIAAQNNLTLRQLRDTVEGDGLDFATYREEIRQQKIIGQLQRREIQSRVNVTDQEIDNFIATQTVQGTANDEYRLLHLLISVPEAASPDAIEKARLRAEQTSKKIRAGADFAQTAIAESDGPNALEGGDMGWRRAGQLPTLFASEVIHMKKGDIAGPIRSPGGFHLIKLDDKRLGQKHVVQQTLARHILIKPNELNTETDVISRLRQLKQRIEGGDSFEDLARSHSDDRGSAVKGGDLGWINPGDMVPQFEAVIKELSKGSISEPFQSQFGWHIAQVLDRRSQDNSEQFNRTQAREALRQRKSDELQESWLRQLREEAYVELKTASGNE